MNDLLTYAEYTERGGQLDEAAFSRWIGRATARITADTHGRLDEFDDIPFEAKMCARDIVEILDAHLSDGMEAASRSESVGGVSESVTYAEAGTESLEKAIDEAECDWLLWIFTPHGRPVLYRGAR